MASVLTTVNGDVRETRLLSRYHFGRILSTQASVVQYGAVIGLSQKSVTNFGQVVEAVFVMVSWQYYSRATSLKN